jgi:hypothetical protein
MKGSKYAKLGNKKGRLAYRTPSRIKAGLPQRPSQAGNLRKNKVQMKSNNKDGRVEYLRIVI